MLASAMTRDRPPVNADAPRTSKIIATLGPASDSPAAIEMLARAGVDAFRLNMSHGTHAEHRARFKAIRTIEKKVDRAITVLGDLQGPKLRVGDFADGIVELRAGSHFRLDLDPALGDAARASLPHPQIFEALERGSELLLDDGRIRLRTLRHGPDFADCEVITGGRLSNHKGVNVPGVILPLSPLTEKDRKDLSFALGLGVDWVAQSFVQRSEDVAELRKLVAGRAGIMVKLEKPAAIDWLDEILELADGAMVARGDLGVELPPEHVPGIQKRVIARCRQVGKPVVVATQMLESMIGNPAPTRAEASDVATAVFDGADAVMLSAETAAGRYPHEAVEMMRRIIHRVQEDDAFRRVMDAQHPDPEATTPDAISAAATQVAHTIKAKAIVAFSLSGSTTLRMARERPDVPVIGLTSKPEIARRLALVWGVRCLVTSDVKNLGEMADKATRLARDAGLAGPGDRIVITAGVPFGTPGATNVLRIAWVE